MTFGSKSLLLDSCFIRFYLERERSALKFLEKIDSIPFVSAVTVSEILHGTKLAEIKLIMDFLNNFKILKFAKEESILAGILLRERQEELWQRKGKRITNKADFFIAASAIFHKFKVVTNNLDDFRKIKKLPSGKSLQILKFKI